MDYIIPHFKNRTTTGFAFVYSDGCAADAVVILSPLNPGVSRELLSLSADDRKKKGAKTKKKGTKK